ncbi:MAG: hypothetical protein ABR616_05740 [Dermatophilaceae bacterium]|nr:hypothetical protein [Intrasporangiaceae bacterium]
MTGDRRDEVRPGRRAEDVYIRWNVKIRDTIIFVVGVVGVVNELFLVSQVRPSILIFLGSLIGVPFVLSADEKRTTSRVEDGEQEGPS